MKTQTIQTDKPYAEFVGYQQDERIGGVRAWYMINWPGHARHLSTVFAPTIIGLEIDIPKTPPYIPTHAFKQVWIHRCENKACHISYISTKPLMEHIRNTKHTEAVSELVNTTDMPNIEETKANGSHTAHMLKEGLKVRLENPLEEVIEDTIPDDPYKYNPFDPPVTKKKRKLVLIPGGLEETKEESREIIKIDAERILKEVIPEASKPKEEVKPGIKIEEPDDAALSFRKKIHTQFPNIPWGEV